MLVANPSLVLSLCPDPPSLSCVELSEGKSLASSNFPACCLPRTNLLPRAVAGHPIPLCNLPPPPRFNIILGSLIRYLCHTVYLSPHDIVWSGSSQSGRNKTALSSSCVFSFSFSQRSASSFSRLPCMVDGAGEVGIEKTPYGIDNSYEVKRVLG